MTNTKTQTTPIRAVQTRICQDYGITLEMLLSRRRTEPLATIRQTAMAVARRETGASYPKLARAFNRKDHVCVLHACRRMGVSYEVKPR